MMSGNYTANQIKVSHGLTIYWARELAMQCNCNNVERLSGHFSKWTEKPMGRKLYAQHNWFSSELESERKRSGLVNYLIGCMKASRAKVQVKASRVPQIWVHPATAGDIQSTDKLKIQSREICQMTADQFYAKADQVMLYSNLLLELSMLYLTPSNPLTRLLTLFLSQVDTVSWNSSYHHH